ncbi:Auxin-induced protein [Macleaya cordata]|uniref:Auxin-induced protein n=1 Tax=Macleaya cordata TaxID=56857 RepID=A0A200Q921_MACCD|nr:Auxin-induced protein [Macleaya cordata]
MAKTSKIKRERRGSMVKLRLIMEKLQRGLSESRRLVVGDNEYREEDEAAEMVPEDVQEGHFAVFAVEGDEKKRFIFELGFLTNPGFLRLLEQAEEEFGFEQDGVLEVPCRPDELQSIL